MNTYWNDLPKLTDIQNDLIIQENNYTNKDIDEFKEGILYFIDDFINQNIRLYKEYDFETILFEEIYDIVSQTYSSIIDDSNIDFSLEHHIFDAIEIYFYKNNSFRSYSGTTIVQNPDKSKIKKLLKKYENVEQPEQQTKEWFEFRREGLSASDIWKSLDTPSQKNNLIYSKCKDIDMTKKQSVNIHSAFHNGHKYEPLSIMQYEFDYDTVVGEFGCIKHEKYNFLRASPDGINIKEDSSLYGRLVEVKNPVSRKLTGIPKKEYWIQMQLQMEVWDLDECDFLETVYKDYPSEEEFYKDGESFTRTADGKRKGIIIQFFYNDKPHYEYPPVDISKNDYEIWYNKIMEKNSHMSWVTNCYWYLQDYSCVLVPRNKKWFNTVYPDFKNLWDTVLKERESGFEHRKPKKKNVKKKLTPNSLKKFKTDTKKLFIDSNISPIIDKQQNVVIKIRTESFDFPDD